MKESYNLKLGPIISIFLLWSGVLLFPFVDDNMEWFKYMLIYCAAWIMSFVTMYFILTGIKEKK